MSQSVDASNSGSSDSDEDAFYSSSASTSSSWNEDAHMADTDSTSEPPQCTCESSGNHNNTATPIDQERQILLLMLLGQLCALHDPTPKTFTSHVLELFERGILDRQSIQFLHSLGLVPPLSPERLLLTVGDTQGVEGASTTSLALAVTSNTRMYARSTEASAIRTSLERAEQQRLIRQASIQSEPVSFAAEHHPLSLSRYQREFHECTLLSSGSFGYVFHAINKLDGRPYAIKRVAFNATGYSRDSVQQVVREVHCLAVCDHPHVVRYNTCWLEPSWMTGSGVSAPHATTHQKLLTDIQQLVTGHEPGDVSDEMKSYFKSKPQHRRRFTMDDSRFELSDGSLDEINEWSVEEHQSFAKDDSYLDMPGKKSRQPLGLSARRAQQRNQQQRPTSDYQYQICLFIQMELCKPVTLADWIRKRNQTPISSIGDRIHDASEIFSQIASGLAHVHTKGIVHRDLKPGNIFASNECDTNRLHYKIGDFGLSKLIHFMASSTNERRPGGASCVDYAALDDVDEVANADAWQDPLTAGVGTASYAAPEQVTTRSYGKEADIFSMGLVLLELLCCFSTEHERMQTFHDCRHRRILPEAFDGFPSAADTILACTNPMPDKRPSASALLLVDITKDRTSANHVDPVDVQALLDQLADKNRQLAHCREELAQKQLVIDELQRDVESFKRSSSAGHLFLQRDHDGSGEGSQSGPASTSSSEDEL